MVSYLSKYIYEAIQHVWNEGLVISLQCERRKLIGGGLVSKTFNSFLNDSRWDCSPLSPQILSPIHTNPLSIAYLWTIKLLSSLLVSIRRMAVPDNVVATTATPQKLFSNYWICLEFNHVMKPKPSRKYIDHPCILNREKCQKLCGIAHHLGAQLGPHLLERVEFWSIAHLNFGHCDDDFGWLRGRSRQQYHTRVSCCYQRGVSRRSELAFIINLEMPSTFLLKVASDGGR